MAGQNDGVSGADLVAAVGQDNKGAGQKKEWVPWKKAFGDDILDKPCCLHSSEQWPDEAYPPAMSSPKKVFIANHHILQTVLSQAKLRHHCLDVAHGGARAGCLTIHDPLPKK